ncbi:unnamed protein product [Kluyveromyces dobzhanskii CBS 2104]|uniref:WGS project CCBQ000000000 data, contig 00012 n=1 Tax=Kluyveromyces dobzhanskii CBS 2104 TaxID=1427455 RepID=A0A0A8L304_9SACH|nr:unnamed protein product [Kluyveromyces dobzhanskii CBS 2104]
MTEYYKAPEIFRQNAIIVKKTTTVDSDGNSNGYGGISPVFKRNCSAESSKLSSPLLRKVSGDLNDVIFTKKLRTDCWKLSDDTKGVTSMSLDADTILLSTSQYTDNLQLFQLRDNDNGQRGGKLLHSLQTITVPGKSILATHVMPLENNKTVVSFDDTVHDRILLSGHSDGYVNLISTSTEDGNAKILKRFNHAKHLKVTTDSMDSLDLASEIYDMHRSKPIRHLKSWNKHHFTSIINDSLFVYDVNQQSKDPLYLNSFPGLEHVDANPVNPFTLSLAGTKFGPSGIALLDLRSSDSNGLRVPESPQRSSGNTDCHKSFASKWLDEYTVVNAVGKDLKVWDIRYGTVKAQLLGHHGFVTSLDFDNDMNKIYSTDDQGLIMSWAMNGINYTDYTLHCGPSHGIQSFGLPKDCVQNGNIIQSPDLERAANRKHIGSHFVGLSNSRFVSLQDQELRSYSIVDMPMMLPPPRNPLRLAKPQLNDLHSELSQSPANLSSDETSKDSSNSAFEDSEDTLEYEAHSPMTPLLDSMFEGKVHEFDIPSLPLLSGIRRGSDATFV